MAGLTETNYIRTKALILGGNNYVNAAFSAAVEEYVKQFSALYSKLEAMPLTDADKMQLKKLIIYEKVSLKASLRPVT